MSGSRLDGLVAAKDLMWQSIQDAEPDKRAPLMNQWRALEASISELETETGKAGDPLDEISARRAARGGATARTRRAKGGAG